MATTSAPRPLCVAPFTALRVGSEGSVSPCCEFVGEVGTLKENTLREIWGNKAFHDLRMAMATGEKIEACWKCWRAEETGGESLRLSLNSRFADRLPLSATQEALPPDDPVYLDIRFSNLCNFKCRTCHHGASSRWYKDAKALGQTAGDKALLSAFDPAEDARSQFEQIGSNVSDLYFAGGEPLMEKQHFELLRWLIAQNRTDIRLSYNTNLSTLDFEGSDIIRLWKEFPYLFVEASIDAIGAEGAFIRSGFDWANFQSNLKRLREECRNARIKIGVTVSVFNVLKIAGLHKKLVEDCGIDTEAFNFHAVLMPRYYDIAILPKGIKERAMVQIEAYAAELSARNPVSPVAAQLGHIVDHMNRTSENTDAHRKQFRDITDQLDNLRSENTLSCFPELSALF